MKVITSEYAHHLLTLPWLERVGQTLDAPEVTIVHSWKAAVAFCESPERDDMLLDMQGEITHASSNALGERWYNRNWNKMADEVRAVIREPLRSHLSSLVGAKGLSRWIVDDISWCTIHACFEVELSEYIETTFYRDHVKWYECGHFPCGWDGEYPEGRLIVF